MRMEPQIWDALIEVTKRENLSVHQLCSLVAERSCRPESLTAAIRVFLLAYFRSAATEDGHLRAKHGNSDLLGQISAVFPDVANDSGAPTRPH
ncbi:ribbon-helix-helix domain-containing protein [Aerophototrophica crusticola]|uniref:Ribbon-helix-helix domain-containing protein n=2 Tax=Aerophototrophica crusticola TaxID=1709002 RepID=A0A858RBN9_9PROT|nr:ribbon-helix-helix domain-containing protein [Rhodospirillaceae bacterium B3]